MNTLDLEKILNSRLSESKYGIPELDSDAYQNIIKAMQDACNQILDLAAENAESFISNGDASLEIDDFISSGVDKESILKLKFIEDEKN